MPFDGAAVNAFYGALTQGNLSAAHDAVCQIWNDEVRRALYGEMLLRAVEWGDLTYAQIASQFAAQRLDVSQLARCRDAAAARGDWRHAIAARAALGEPTLDRDFLRDVIGGIDSMARPRRDDRAARRVLAKCRSALDEKSSVESRRSDLFPDVASVLGDGARSALDQLVLQAAAHLRAQK